MGSTISNSSHTRIELDGLSSFAAGAARHVLTATDTVTQLPNENPDVILGQIHVADGLSSIPYVMLHDRGGAIGVVVKQQQSGSASANYPLLDSVALGTSFRFTIRDNGDGGLTFTAASGGQTATANAPVPPAFSGAAVRFQAGAYHQADSAGRRWLRGRRRAGERSGTHRRPVTLTRCECLSRGQGIVQPLFGRVVSG